MTSETGSELPAVDVPADLLRWVLDALTDPVFVKDRQLRFIGCNAALCGLLGRTYETTVGHVDADFFPPDQVEVFRRIDEQVLRTGEPHEIEESLTASGELRRIVTRKYPLRDADGQIRGLCGIITDITALHRRQDRIARLEAELERLTLPVLQIWDSTLLLPMVGTFDDLRAGRVVSGLLDAITARRARFVLIDLTGIAEVDPAIAPRLVQLAGMTALLGCESILVGIRPALAQALASQGLSFGATPICSTLQAGLELALRRLG